MTIPHVSAALALALLFSAAPVAAQSNQPAIFIANNGNNTGSVTSMLINADGSLDFVSEFITGVDPEPDTNPQAISISPGGRWLVTGHGTINGLEEQLTIIEVNSDATMSLKGEFITNNSPLGVQWLDDTHLVATATTPSSRILAYVFDPDANSLTLVDTELTGSFTTAVAYDPEQRYLFVQDSGQNQITSFFANADGTLDRIDVFDTLTTFPLGPGISPDGRFIYAGGGISNGGDKIIGAEVFSDGTMSAIGGQPFISPGASPKEAVVMGDTLHAAIGHGTDATVRIFSIDQETGALTSTGHFFDVGGQGTLGCMAAMGDLLFFTDNTTSSDGVRGVYSFTINPDGSMTQNGPLVDTQGVNPRMIATWSPRSEPPVCPWDCTPAPEGNGIINVDDLFAVLNAIATQDLDCDVSPENKDGTFGNGVINYDDVVGIINHFGDCP